MSGLSHEIRVYYEDTDSGGVVYYANYLKFMERGRTEWLRSLGFDQEEVRARLGVVFAVRSVEVDYRLPGRLDDLLTVSCELKTQKRASLEFVQEVRRGDELLVSGRVRIACIDIERFRPAPIPEEILSRMSR